MVNPFRLEAQFFVDVGRRVAPEVATQMGRWPRSCVDDVASLRRDCRRLKAEGASELVQARRDKLFTLAMSALVDQVKFKRQMNRLDSEAGERLARMAEIRSVMSADKSRNKS